MAKALIEIKSHSLILTLSVQKESYFDVNCCCNKKLINAILDFCYQCTDHVVKIPFRLSIIISQLKINYTLQFEVMQIGVEMLSFFTYWKSNFVLKVIFELNFVWKVML